MSVPIGAAPTSDEWELVDTPAFLPLKWVNFEMYFPMYTLTPVAHDGSQLIDAPGLASLPFTAPFSTGFSCDNLLNQILTLTSLSQDLLLDKLRHLSFYKVKIHIFIV